MRNKIKDAIVKFKNKVDNNPKRSVLMMFLILIGSFTLMFFMTSSKDEFAVMKKYKKNAVEESLTTTDNFSLGNYFKVRKMKEKLEEIRSKPLNQLTREDTLVLVQIIGEYDRIDPSLKNEFEKKIEREKHKSNLDTLNRLTNN